MEVVNSPVRINWEAFLTRLVKETVRTNAVSERSPDLFVQGNEILSHQLHWSTRPRRISPYPLHSGPAPPCLVLCGHPVTSLCGTALLLQHPVRSQLTCRVSVSMSLSHKCLPVTESKALFQSFDDTSLCFIFIITLINCCILLICWSTYLWCFPF